MMDYIFDKKEIKEFYELNQIIRKYYKNYIVFNNSSNIHYGLEPGDLKKINTFKYSLVSLTKALPDIFNEVQIYGDELNNALKDKCSTVVREDSKLIMKNGKSETKFVVGRLVRESTIKKINTFINHHNSLQPKSIIGVDVLDDRTLDNIIEYQHVKEVIGYNVDKDPINMYLTIQLFPAVKKLTTVKIEVGKYDSDVDFDTYVVNIISTNGNVTVMSTHRIINVD